MERWAWKLNKSAPVIWEDRQTNGLGKQVTAWLTVTWVRKSSRAQPESSMCGDHLLSHVHWWLN